MQYGGNEHVSKESRLYDVTLQSYFCNYPTLPCWGHTPIFAVKVTETGINCIKCIQNVLKIAIDPHVEVEEEKEEKEEKEVKHKSHYGNYLCVFLAGDQKETNICRFQLVGTLGWSPQGKLRFFNKKHRFNLKKINKLKIKSQKVSFWLLRLGLQLDLGVALIYYVNNNGRSS